MVAGRAGECSGSVATNGLPGGAGAGTVDAHSPQACYCTRTYGLDFGQGKFMIRNPSPRNEEYRICPECSGEYEPESFEVGKGKESGLRSPVPSTAFKAL